MSFKHYIYITFFAVSYPDIVGKAVVLGFSEIPFLQMIDKSFLAITFMVIAALFLFVFNRYVTKLKSHYLGCALALAYTIDYFFESLYFIPRNSLELAQYILILAIPILVGLVVHEKKT